MKRAPSPDSDDPLDPYPAEYAAKRRRKESSSSASKETSGSDEQKEHLEPLPVVVQGHTLGAGAAVARAAASSSDPLGHDSSHSSSSRSSDPNERDTAAAAAAGPNYAAASGAAWPPTQMPLANTAYTGASATNMNPTSAAAAASMLPPYSYPPMGPPLYPTPGAMWPPQASSHPYFAPQFPGGWAPNAFYPPPHQVTPQQQQPPPLPPTNPFLPYNRMMQQHQQQQLQPSGSMDSGSGSSSMGSTRHTHPIMGSASASDLVSMGVGTPLIHHMAAPSAPPRSSQAPTPTPSPWANGIPLGLPTDEEHLSEYHCLVRAQIDLFAAGPVDLQGSMQGRNRPIVLHQVGLRCRHCAPIDPPNRRPPGAVYYPSKLTGLYQAAINMAKNHFLSTCNTIPADVKARLTQLKDKKTYMLGGGKGYWSTGGRIRHVVEVEDRLFFEKATASTSSDRREEKENNEEEAGNTSPNPSAAASASAKPKAEDTPRTEDVERKRGG